MKRGKNSELFRCSFFSENYKGMKKGLSTIVITLIITLLALVAIGIVWVVIRNLLANSSNEIGFEQFTTKLDIVNAYEQSGSVNVIVKRTVGEGSLIKIKFVLTGEENSEVITESTSLQELESKNFIIVPSDISAKNVSMVSVAPVIRLPDGTERLLDITDTYYLIHLEGNQTTPQNETEPETGECSPSCSGSTPYCVTGECVACRSSVDCTGTDTCTNGVCVSDHCIPQSDTETCGSWVCGTRVNNCGAFVVCGTCSAGMFCSNGVCAEPILVNEGTVEETWPGSSGMYFGSSDLPTENVDYTGYYLSYTDATECLLIALFRTPVVGYPKSHIGFNFETSIATDNHYKIWQNLNECQADII